MSGALRITLASALLAALFGAGAGAAGGSHVYPATDAVWKDECGSCHVAYPPQLLPAASWRSIMDGLDRHFGVDASVDAQAARHVAAFLESKAAGPDTRNGVAVTRITQTRWFRREHDELSADVWKRADVKTPANCAACHTRADAGDYSGRTRRVPR